MAWHKKSVLQINEPSIRSKEARGGRVYSNTENCYWKLLEFMIWTLLEFMTDSIAFEQH